MLARAFAVGLAVVSQILPAPPRGYSWSRFATTKSAFLKPDGWYVSDQQLDEQVRAHFITKENLERTGYACTGLMVFVSNELHGERDVVPSAFARDLIDNLAQKGEVVKPPWHRSLATFESFGVVTTRQDERCGPVTEHRLAIANDRTRTLYLISFQGKNHEWQKAWRTGEPILKKFLIDTER